MESRRASIAELKEGGEFAIYGKVIRTFDTPKSPAFTLMDETGHIDVYFREPFLPGDFAYASGLVAREGKKLLMKADYAERLSGKGASEIDMLFGPALERISTPLKAGLMLDDKVMRALKPKFSRAASMMLRALRLLRPITVRFHGDTDGICGAVCLYLAMKKVGGEDNIIFEQNTSATYSPAEALRDVRASRAHPHYTLPPLFVLVDFASNDESVDAVRIVKTAGYELLIIDHHPPNCEVETEADLIVSPWEAGGSSDYTAGLLCGEVAKRMAEVKVEELQRTALAGDRSQLMAATGSHEKGRLERDSLALDYLASCRKFPETIEFYSETLGDRMALAGHYEKAHAKIMSIVGKAKEIAKERRLRNGFTVFTVRMDKVVKLGEYPTKGRATSFVHDELCSSKKGPCITLGLGGNSIVIRANGTAEKKGFNASKIIGGINEEMKNALEGGGGHARAASMRMKGEFSNIVLDELMKRIGEIRGARIKE
ncbi:MAG: DHH family phosphoesterase [Candidatus Micrarchaeota archaeon]|nr:DHH family phosphoesterase [Candidatus Micrarchaeota archaeon]